MTVRIATLFIYLFIHLFTVLSLAETAEKTAQSWKLDGKEVPIPLGSSESLQNSLRGIDQPNVAARIKQAPRNRQQWDQMISERAEARNIPLDQVEKNDEREDRSNNNQWCKRLLGYSSQSFQGT